MKKRVRIVKAPLPKAKAGMNFSAPLGGGHPAYDGSLLAPGSYLPVGNGSEPEMEVNTTLKPTDRERANLEAEKGETVVTTLNKDGIPELYTIGGKRHYDGGTPLNLPQDSFIFSRDKKLKIKDKDILAQFGKNVGKKGKKAFTPAELSQQYNLNKYRKVLADPNADRLQRETAELMIQNYNLKLGGLAMVQESMKGFEDGIPGIAMPYLEHAGIDPTTIVEPPAGAQMPEMPQMPMQRYGGAPNAAAIKQIEPTSNVKYQMGGATGLPEGAVVRRTPQGTLEVVGPDGTVIGQVNAPNQYGVPAGGFTTGAPAEGGTPSTSTKSTRSQNIPDNAVKWDQSAEGYDESQVQPGDYIKKSDGKWYRATGYSAAPYTGNYQNPNLKGEFGDLEEAYGRLNDTIYGNENLQNAIVENYYKTMDKVKPNPRTGLTQADIDKAKSMQPDEIINNFMQMQEQVMAVNAHMGNMEGVDPEDQWDKNRENYKKTVGNLGYTPLEDWQTAAFQGAYVSLQNIAGMDEYKDVLKDFDVTQVGIGDEPGGGTGRATISDIDGWVGNTTIGQAALYKPVKDQLDMQEAEWTEEKQEEAAKEIQHLEPQAQPEYAPWWLQDIVNVAGSTRDFFGVKKHTPWQATPGVHLPSPTFQDPTRQLGQNAALARIATEGAAAFAGPQAYNARAAQIQGQAANNVANTLAQVHGQNVQIANQFEMAKTDIMNRASDRKAQLSTQLYDKNTIANQQFDNAKNQARQQMRQGYIDAITNRAMTQTMNQLYPQYNVDPSQGGFMHFTQGRDLKPTQPNTTGVADKFQEYKRLNPGVTDDVLYKMAAADMGVQTMPESANYVNPAQFAYPGMMGG